MKGKIETYEGNKGRKERESEGNKEENVCMNEERRLNKWRFYGCKNNK